MKDFTNPHTINILDTNITGDDNSQFFLTPIKHNHGVTVQSLHVPLRSDSLHCQQNITTNITCKKFLYLERSIFFLLTVELPDPHSVPNQ